MRLVSIAASTLGLAGLISAYGDLGHRTVANLARKYMTQQTKEHVDALLTNDRGFDFSDAALWADRIKYGSHARPYTKPWHYIDAIDIGNDMMTPPEGCGLHYPADCNQDKGPPGCIISAMANQTKLFMSTDSSKTTRKEALMFLMHLFGDLHQPLHVEDAFRGGNEIHTCFDDDCAENNLHKVWDTGIVNKMNGLGHSPSDMQEKEAAMMWADQLHELNEKHGIAEGNECTDVMDSDRCTLSWARESNSWICRYVMRPNAMWLMTNNLGGEYYAGAMPIVEELIAKAGTRLGAWLNTMVLKAMKNREQVVLGENPEL